MKNKKIIIAAATLAMIAAASVGPAMAYFTDSHYAYGVVPVNLGDSELTPHEKVTGMVKTITVENTGDYDVYVRVQAFCGSNVKVEMTAGEGWTKDGDYYVYNEVVKAHESTKSSIEFTITPPADSDQKDFNVIIIEEATRATYKADGTPNKPDWSLAVKKQEVVQPEQQPTTDNNQPDTNENNEGGNN